MIKFRLIIKSFLPLAYLFIKKRATKEKGNTKGMGSYMKGTYFIENDIFKGFRGLNLNPPWCGLDTQKTSDLHS